MDVPEMQTAQRIKVGVVGLGFGSTLTLPYFVADKRFEIVAAVDPRSAARDAFATRFGGEAFSCATELFERSSVDLVYICTPPYLHREQVEEAAAYRRHILVEKPMALTVADCDQMIRATDEAGVMLMYGHTHSYDPPIKAIKELVRSGEHGTVQMVQNWTFTDLLYRARAEWELNDSVGGGAVYIQAAHQIDIIRMLVGDQIASVTAHTYCFDATRKAHGAYVALLSFKNGASATIVYNGYGHFDTAELHGWVGEDGNLRPPDTHAKTHQARINRNEEAEREARRFGLANLAETAVPFHSHFGLTLVSLSKADIRQTPNGLSVYSNKGRIEIGVEVGRGGRGVMLDELYSALTGSRQPLHDGKWGRDTLAVCEAILQSARSGKAMELRRGISKEEPPGRQT
ncbi:Gfo/Idh/MocA family oxidoreductase [Pseudorhodoplanes sp.]|uniref:Gfo/Idh/MocA family oxidoreductase n=1 Tax=Pseudorhodoplanes sp. TaxID=1934341 RepID=UPI003D1171A2